MWLLLFGVLLFAGGQFAIQRDIAKVSDQIASENDLTLTLGQPEGRGFDPRITGTAPKSWQSLLALRGLRTAVEVYPRNVLSTYAPRVLIAGRIEILDYRVGGTVQPGWVLLATDYLGLGAGPAALARVFHHEVSSLLIANRPFPDAAWRATLPPGFSYPEDDTERLKATQVYAADVSSFFADGFVSDYGSSSLENDINTYAELLLSDPEKLAALSAEYPAIAKKALIIRNYYEALHPDFAARFSERDG